MPQDCKIVVITRRLNTTCKMVSTKLKRANIECALCLLKKTGLPPWKDIDISESKLEVWSEKGDFAGHFSTSCNMVVFEGLG